MSSACRNAFSLCSALFSWRRCGTDICYVKTDMVHPSRNNDQIRFHHHLSWTHVFEHDHDVVYFAHCYPYTYTGLHAFQSYIIS